MGGRQDSLHFPDLQIAELEAFEQSKLTLGIDFMPHGFRGESEDNEAGSLYFTPTGTPMRELPPTGAAAAIIGVGQKKKQQPSAAAAKESGGGNFSAGLRGDGTTGGSERNLNKSGSLKNTPTREHAQADLYRYERLLAGREGENYAASKPVKSYY